MVAEKGPTMTHETLPIARSTRINGRDIGRLAYGCWRIHEGDQASVAGKLDAALEIGANMIDTADIYGFGAGGFGQAEEMLGILFGERPGMRDDIFLVTKGGITPPVPYNSTASYLVEACEASLRRLNTDHVDLYLIHRPDNLTAHSDVAAALTGLKESGKVGAVGVSNYTLEQTRAVQTFLDFPLAVIQPEISALEVSALTNGLLDYAQSAGLIPMAWSPLAGGSLATGVEPTNRDFPNFSALIVALDALAAKNETTRDAVALAWLLAHPAGIIPIIGTQSPDRIRASAAAFEVALSRNEWYAIFEASLGHKMP